MSGTDELETLSEILALEGASFLRYIAETGATEVRDDADRRAFAFYDEWAGWARRQRDALTDLLTRESVFPVTRQYPLTYSLFNYLSAAFLLKHVIEKMGLHLEQVERLAGGLAPDSEARRLVESMLQREREFLARARKLEEERPREPPKPAKIKGTSAARW
jgi:hypothetical protein